MVHFFSVDLFRLSNNLVKVTSTFIYRTHYLLVCNHIDAKAKPLRNEQIFMVLLISSFLTIMSNNSCLWEDSVILLLIVQELYKYDSPFI